MFVASDQRSTRRCHHRSGCRSRIVISNTLLALALLIGVIDRMAPALAASPTWSTVPTPAAGPARVYGSYAGGCLAGAVRLSPDGEGYQAIRLSRHRTFGHPSLISFVEQFGRQVAAEGVGLVIIGDLAQPRGGPMSYGHVSHQSGLDVDVWFRIDLPRLARAEREGLRSVSMVTADGNNVDEERWTWRQATMLRVAAQHPDVARIFVNPAIKRHLCRQATADRGWLRRLRPWRGHTSHFHVRLHCPADSPDCKAQPEPPFGDGCTPELYSWTSPVASTLNFFQALKQFLLPPPQPAPRRPSLPSACTSVLAAGETESRP